MATGPAVTLHATLVSRASAAFIQRAIAVVIFSIAGFRERRAALAAEISPFFVDKAITVIVQAVACGLFFLIERDIVVRATEDAVLATEGHELCTDTHAKLVATLCFSSWSSEFLVSLSIAVVVLAIT